MTHEDAVATLKKTQDRVVIVVSRVGMMYTDSGTPPPVYHEAVKASECSVLCSISPVFNSTLLVPCADNDFISVPVPTTTLLKLDTF